MSAPEPMYYEEMLLENAIDETYYVVETFKHLDNSDSRLLLNLINLYNRKKAKWNEDFNAYKTSILNNQPVQFDYMKSYNELNALKNLIVKVLD